MLFLSYTDMQWWLLSNVKSLFDHVTRRYDVASLGAESERQDLQADWEHLPTDAFQTEKW